MAFKGTTWLFYLTLRILAAGSCIGGAFLRVGLGLEKAIEVHNGGCYLDANGPVSVGQAAALEFMGAFSL